MSHPTRAPEVLLREPLPSCDKCGQPLRDESFEGELHALLRHIEAIVSPDTESEARKTSLRTVRHLAKHMREHYRVWTPGPWVQ